MSEVIFLGFYEEVFFQNKKANILHKVQEL